MGDCGISVRRERVPAQQRRWEGYVIGDSDSLFRDAARDVGSGDTGLRAGRSTLITLGLRQGEGAARLSDAVAVGAND